jgi:hypothetical protein
LERKGVTLKFWIKWMWNILEVDSFIQMKDVSRNVKIDEVNIICVKYSLK